VTLISLTKTISRHSKSFLTGASSNQGGVVEIDVFAVFPLLYLRKFQKYRQHLHITTTHRSGFLPAPIRMILNDLECRIQLKVCFTDGTLDVRMLWLSEIRAGHHASLNEHGP